MSAHAEILRCLIPSLGDREGRVTTEEILAALTAAGYAVEQGWQPIETAPRDRSWIMTYQRGHGRVRAINIDYWAEEDGGWNGKPPTGALSPPARRGGHR